MRPHSLVTAITGSVRPSHVGGTARHRHQTPGRCAASLARHCHHRVSAASLPVLSISLSFARRGVPLTAVSVLLKLSLGRVLSVSLFSLTRAFFPLYFSHTVAFCVLCFVLCFVFCVWSDARFFRLTVRHTVVPHPRISHCFAALRSVASSNSESSSSLLLFASGQSRAMCPRLWQL